MTYLATEKRLFAAYSAFFITGWTATGSIRCLEFPRSHIPRRFITVRSRRWHRAADCSDQAILVSLEVAYLGTASRTPASACSKLLAAALFWTWPTSATG